MTDVRLVLTDSDERSMSETLRLPDIEALCVEPMQFEEWLMLRRLVREHCVTTRPPRLVLLAHGIDSWFVYKVLAHGIDDVIDLAATNHDLLDAVRTVIDGHDVVCRGRLLPRVDVVPLVNAFGIRYADEVDWKVVSLVASGYTDREIAEIINYSHQSVRNRVSRILFNSGLRNRTQLAVQYVFERLEEPSGAGGGLASRRRVDAACPDASVRP